MTHSSRWFPTPQSNKRADKPTIHMFMSIKIIIFGLYGYICIYYVIVRMGKNIPLLPIYFPVT